MRVAYHKLVRDRVPEIIRADGQQPCTAIMSLDAEYFLYLIDKIKEESAEYDDARDIAEQRKEIADCMEVVDALCAVYRICPPFWYCPQQLSPRTLPRVSEIGLHYDVQALSQRLCNAPEAQAQQIVMQIQALVAHEMMRIPVSIKEIVYTKNVRRKERGGFEGRVFLYHIDQ